MLGLLSTLQNVKLYLTRTPFKGTEIIDYPAAYRRLAVAENEDPAVLLHTIAGAAEAEDLAIVTGSLYLVGLILQTTKAISVTSV